MEFTNFLHSILAMMIFIKMSTSSVNKRKLCKRLDLLGDRGDYGLLSGGSITSETMVRCMGSCTSNPDCWVVNYNKLEKLCELLPEYPDVCLDPPGSGSSNFTMRVLGTCDGTPPEVIDGSLFSPNVDDEGNFIWVAYYDDPFSTIPGYEHLPSFQMPGQCCIVYPGGVYHLGKVIPGWHYHYGE